MRFAVTCTDRYLSIFQTLVECGWTPVKVFTTRVDNRIHRNTAVLDFARRLKLDVQISRLTESNLRELADQGCEALVVASYEWRIGDWRPYLQYALNFHPAPLPRARGAYPLPAAILEESPTWGLTCHKVEHEFDTGDVLKKVEFPLAPDEDHDSLDLKLQMMGRPLAADIAAHLNEYWTAATPQGAGRYYPKWTEADRRLDFSQPVAGILRRIRAFGPIECIAQLEKMQLFVRRAVGWTGSHKYPPGTVVYVNNLSFVIAAADGYVGLTEWSLINADAVTGTLRR
jgi:methionyl-tRNA formyltransferase